MFQSEQLKSHLETKHTIRANPKVYAEINLNDPTNIDTIGVYRYRPSGPDVSYRSLPVTWDAQDIGDHYSNADMSYAEIGGTYEEGIELAEQDIFREDDTYFNELYSLEDCFRHQRPRSGINKLLYLGPGGAQRRTPQFVDGGGDNPAMRPRFYASNRNDYFKYWTSYKREGNNVFGISYEKSGVYQIDDAVPFVVYKNHIPANRIVVKMQTLIGNKTSGQIRHHGSLASDPFMGTPKAPGIWSVQVLQNGAWSTAYQFNNGVEWHGNVEIGYGLLVPNNYLSTFNYAGVLTSDTFLPKTAAEGTMYLVITSKTDVGTCWIMSETGWVSFAPEYGWMPEPDAISGQSHFVTKIVDPHSYGSGVYREFQMIQGIRVVVETMQTPDSTFDLIELSPRLAMDWSERAESFSVTKSMSDLGNSSLPVGRLMASTGEVSLSNNDSAFNINNKFNRASGLGSIIAEHFNARTKFHFVENILDVDGYDYSVPIKTLYSERNPNINNEFTSISVSLRDLFYLFESMNAPSLLMTDVSLSRAVMTLMDYIGFSNYTFKRMPGQADPVIPYFFIPPDKKVAEVMIELATATQSAMYFDEQNNLVVATKEYVLPDSGRDVDIVIRGNDKDGKLANIRAVSSAEKPVYNGGEISYTKRYIQRTYGSLNQAMYQPQDKTWIYSPSLVWEVSGDETTKALNENASTSDYTLTAMPLRTSLSADLPVVAGGRIANNVIDVGDSANFLARYNGYLYANGEIIKYDAAEYSVSGTGNVWIESADDYQNYALGLPFGGKMYPTGLIRIFAEPYFDNGVLRQGPVKRHGRGQFNTIVTNHAAGLSGEWTGPESIAGMFQNPDSLFNMREESEYQKNLRPNIRAGQSRGGIAANFVAKGASRTSIIKNNLSQKFWTESEINNMGKAQSGTVQSSALVFTGPSYPADMNPRDHVSYVHKKLDSYYTNFGTRCRIIGKIETTGNLSQTPIGGTNYFTLPSNNPSTKTHISGGSGGIGINVDPLKNSGYFFEIAALTSADPSSYDVPDTEVETLIGKVTEISISENVATVTIDQSEVRVIPNISVGDSVSLDGVYHETQPTPNGVYVLESIVNNGKSLVFTIPVVPYVWGAYGTVKSGGTDMGVVTEASVDANSIATITFANPVSLYPSNTIAVSGFDQLSSIPRINHDSMTVLTVSPDSRTITFAVPKTNFTFSGEDLERAEISRISTETPRVSNLWFYKIVSDDMGGKVLNWTRNSERTTVTVDAHRLSTGDFVTVTANPAIDGQYQVSGIAGNNVYLNRGGTIASGTGRDANVNTIGLTAPVATTYKLWSGLTNVLVDSGSFVGQYRSMAEEKTTVYDLAIETAEHTDGKMFYLYINNRQVATVLDENPLYRRNGVALFVRGQSKLMFENIYAMGENLNDRGLSEQVDPSHISEVFGIPDGISESESLRKYAVSGFVQSGYLSGINGFRPPHYNMYYDEFGTIMREAAYFNVRYDKAYPALYARIAPVINRIKGYTVSGFMAGAYGAEFMIFNNLDTLCRLDPSTGNYLRINGVVFTQNTSKTLTVDDYLRAESATMTDRSVLRDTTAVEERYDEIKSSRMRYGRNDFSIASDYIQNDDTANRMMGWIISKTIRPRLNIGVDIFQLPILQLGDLVTFDYVDNDGRNVLTEPDRKFVVYNMTYSKSSGEATMVVYTTEV